MAFITPKQLGSNKTRQQLLQTTTVRSFDGGLNVIDNDLNMSPKFAKMLDNLERNIDGSLAVRPGTQLFATTTGDTSDIVNMCYFNGFLITVQNSGHVRKIDGAGTITDLLLGGVTPFTTNTTYTTFTEASSDLLVFNGQDKPLLVSGHPSAPLYMQADHLQDIATASNVNTPVGKFVVNHAQYTVVAGVATAPSSLYISARGTSGTFFGDPAPNDAVIIDLGPRVTMGSATITGLVAYRDKLLVTFERGVLPVNLGVYTGSPAVHTPTDDGFIQEYGCLTHRSLISVGDDTFFCDNIGVNSITRIVLYNTLRPQRASQLIDPAITTLLKNLTQAQIAQYVFAVYDMRNKRYILFIPVFDGNGVLTETIGFSYTNIPVMKVSAWARLRGWKWQCACRSSLQNVFFAQGNKIYVYDLDGTYGYADFMGDTSVSADGKGTGIAFTWEMPWADMNKRMNSKNSKYIGLETYGDAPFTIKMYVDHILTSGNPAVDSPLLATDFVGGDAGGFGNAPFGDAPFGGGRITSDERLFAWNAKFKIMKLIFSGIVTRPLKFISVSIGYTMGTIRR